MSDVVIAGGGPSGLAAAISLAERGARVTVADAQGGVAKRRAELLSHGAAPIMERLGLSGAVQSALVISDVVSQWGTAALQSHGAHPTLGLHGWGIDRHVLSLVMLDRAKQLGVNVLPARVTGQTKTPDGWQVETSSASCNDTLQTQFLIDATGRPASIARRLGATLLQGPDLVALTWQFPDGDHNRMQSEATAEGWWYTVPHSAGGTIGFVTSAAQAKACSRAPVEDLSKALGLIEATAVSQGMSMMDCRSSVLDKASGPGWLATGDAAAAFDPITSQGLFNALSGGFFAGQAAADALAGDDDAPKIYEVLVARTAERTHSTTHLQYAAMPYDTEFWRTRSRPSAS